MNMNESRNAPLKLSKEEFQKAGHALVDKLAQFYDGLPNDPVTSGGNAQSNHGNTGKPIAAGNRQPSRGNYRTRS